MIDSTAPTNAARRARRLEMVLGAYVVGMIASLPLVMLPAESAVANQEVEHLKALGPVVSLEDVIVKAKERQPGRMIEAEVDEYHGKVIYEVDILDDQGRVWELKYDVKTGEFLGRSKEED